MTDLADKPALRKYYRAVRDAITPADRDGRSQVITRLLLSIDKLEHAGSIFVYVSAGNEVGTLGLIESLLDRGKTVAVPRVLAGAGQMQPVVIGSLADLAPGRFGIPEPTKHQRFDTSPDLAIVPGIAFTDRGQRLGQGGGYYDRYLAQHPATYKLGICFNEQLAETLPVNEHDIAMDEVITG